MIRSLFAQSISLFLLLAVQNSSRASSFDTELQRYLHGYESGNRLIQVRSSKKLSAEIFQSAQSSRYIELLNQIDAHAKASPQAVYDLAKTLQLRWEAQYLASLARMNSHSRVQGAKVGLVGSSAALGLLLVFKPSLSPLYFRSFKQALLFSGLTSTVPLAVTLGSEAGEVRAKRQHEVQAIPPAPAEVMNLGGLALPQAQTEPEAEAQIEHEIQDLATRGALGSASYALTQFLAAERLAQLGLAPSKINPLALIFSIGVSFLVEEGVDAGISYSREQQLRQNLERSLQVLQRAETSGNTLSYYDSTELWVKSSLQWAHWISKNALPARASQSLYFALNSIQNQTDSYGSSDGMTLWIRRGFESWKANHESAQGYSMGEGAERAAFHDYLNRWIQSIEMQMALQVRSGDWALSANEFLIQAASVLKQSNDDFADDQATALSALAIRNQWLLQQGVEP